MHLAQAYNLAFSLMQDHGLLEQGWKFKFDRAVRRFGACYYNRRIITLSIHLTSINSEDKVKDVILHEIAHALTPYKFHGPEWVAACIQIGAKPERCYSVADTNTPEHKYRAICPTCQKQFRRHRLPSHNRYCLCARRTGYSTQTVLRWFRDGENPQDGSLSA